MPALPEMQNHAIRHDHVRGHGLHDHLTRTAETRRRRAEAVANGVHRLWTGARRALGRLMSRKARERTPATGGERPSKALGRASVADALRRGLRRPARLLRRFVLEPHGRRARRRFAIARLRALDDRLLGDIGLTRGQIELVVDGLLLRRGEPFTRPPGRAVPAENARDELRMAA